MNTMAEYIKVYYKKFWDHAKEPTHATPYSVGSDLYSAFEYCLPRNEKVTIDTGIGVVIPLAYYGNLISKSRLAHEHAIYVEAGAVNPDYTGPIFVILNNQGDEDYLVYEEIQNLPLTKRGSRGLGVADTSKQITRTQSATTRASTTFTTTTMTSTTVKTLKPSPGI